MTVQSLCKIKKPFLSIRTEISCQFCKKPGHTKTACFRKKIQTVAWLEKPIDKTDPNAKYYKLITINDKPTAAFIDLESSCTTVTNEEVKRFKLNYDSTDRTFLQGYGKSIVDT